MISLQELKARGEDISECGLTFVATITNFGESVEQPLVPGGEAIEVTNDNVDEYVQRYCDWVLNGSIREQFDAFSQGFSEFMKTKQKSLLELFCYHELDLLISGQDIIDWNLLKQNTNYSDGYSSKSRPVLMFWEIFDEFEESDKRMFMRFSTGCDRIPPGNDFHLVIQKSHDVRQLPVSHTCFNTFALPAYPSKEVMKEKVLIAIENYSGFGLI